MLKNTIKLNILVNYANQIYLIIANIISLPIYIKYMGAESYGLVAFFLLLQGLFLLLDFGLTPTLSRQTAIYNAGSLSVIEFLKIYRFLSFVFYGLATLLILSLFLLSDAIINKWLNFENLNFHTIESCFIMMIFCVALRWLVGFYRGIVVGFEKIVWLSLANIIIATLKFFGVILYMAIFGFDVIHFFQFQLIVGILELCLFYFKTQKLLPKYHEYVYPNMDVIKPIWKFSLSIGFTSFVWVLISQLDKFVLSGVLSLSEYGYFSLAVMVAGAITQISTPISSVIMPRMAFLYSNNEISQMRQIYLNATQVVAVFVVTLGLVLVFFAEPILMVWTNDVDITKSSADILKLYVIGNIFLSLASFPYYLQYAKGDMKYHIWGNVVSLIIFLPSIIYFAYHYGAIGTGWVWLITHGLFLIFWVSFVHGKIEPDINYKWFASFLPSVCAVAVFLYLVYSYVPIMTDESRLLSFFQLMLIGLCALFVATIFSRSFMNVLYKKIRGGNAGL